MNSTATAYRQSIRTTSDVAGFRVLQKKRGWFRIPKDKLAERRLVIGRSNKSDFRIRHKTISRRHCSLVTAVNGHILIVDEHSKNGVEIAKRGHCGTYQRVKWHVLEVGDLIRIGNIRMIAVDQHGQCPIQINECADIVRFALQIYGSESRICDTIKVSRSLWRQMCDRLKVAA